VKFERLRQGVLALAAVENEQHLVRRRGIEPLNHSFDLVELVHEPRCRVQAPGRIGQHDLDAARACGDQRVVHDGGRVRAWVLGDYGYSSALTPLLKLLDGRSAERIRCGEQDRSSIGFEAMRKFADGSRLARAVDADGQDHERPVRGRDGERRLDSAQQLERGRAQQLDGRCAGWAPLARGAHLGHEPSRRVDAHVGQQQPRLELFYGRFVERLRAEAAQLRRKPVLAAVQARFELAEKPRALFVFCRGHAFEILDDLLLLV
jgi:hypothetical protein